MYGISDKCKKLSSAEERVMLAVWQARSPITRSEIARYLPSNEWADATLLNFLYRLVAKGWLTQGKEGNKNTYVPTVTRRAYGVYTMRERLDTVFGGDVALAMTALISESSPSVTALEQGKRVIEEKLAMLEDYDWYDPYN
ncbi:MAG: BlaI/MecI/CopY family transcriptional regulator [Faecalibacterium sp.]